MTEGRGFRRSPKSYEPRFCSDYIYLCHAFSGLGTATPFGQDRLQWPVERRNDQDSCTLRAGSGRAPRHPNRLVCDGVRGEGRNARRPGATVGIRLCGLCDARRKRAQAVDRCAMVSGAQVAAAVPWHGHDPAQAAGRFHAGVVCPHARTFRVELPRPAMGRGGHDGGPGKARAHRVAYVDAGGMGRTRRRLKEPRPGLRGCRFPSANSPEFQFLPEFKHQRRGLVGYGRRWPPQWRQGQHDKGREWSGVVPINISVSGVNG